MQCTQATIARVHLCSTHKIRTLRKYFESKSDVVKGTHREKKRQKEIIYEVVCERVTALVIQFIESLNVTQTCGLLSYHSHSPSVSAEFGWEAIEEHEEEIEKNEWKINLLKCQLRM